MTYGTIKVDTVTFTNAGVDKSVTLSGLVQNPVFSGNVTVTGTLSGVTVTGTTANFTSGNFTNISGGTHTITSGVFAAGSAASPSITFTGDLNTGIYSPGADQVAISTGGSGRLFVDASGNIGMGTSSLANNVGYTTLYLNGSTGGSLSFKTGDVTKQIIYSTTNTLNYYGGGSDSHIFYCSTEKMRLTPTGLGVGTSTPRSQLEVNTGAGNDGIRVSEGFHDNDASTYNYTALSYWAKSLGNNRSGNPLTTNGASAAIVFTDRPGVSTFPNSIRTSDIVFYTALNSVASFASVDPLPRMAITAEGRVGVGTTSPSANLHVSASSGTAIKITETNNGVTGALQATSTGPALGSDTNHPLVFYTNAVERLRIDSSGRVGIGTSSPGYLLDIKATATPTIRIQETTNGPEGRFLASASDVQIGTFGGSPLSFYTNSAERMRLDTSGRLGIGTTSPGGMLHVAGATILGDNGTNGRCTIETNTSRIALSATTTGFAAYQNLEVYSAATIFYRGATESARLDSSGRLLVGTSSALGAARLETLGNSFVSSAILARINSNDTNPTGFVCAKDRAGSIVQSGDQLGACVFRGYDGSNYLDAAFVRGEVDGTPGANDMPGRLVFSTTADGASSPTERLRIDSSGNLLVANAVSTFIGQYEGGSINPSTANYFVGMQCRLGTDRNLILTAKTGDSGGNILFQTGVTSNGVVPERMRINSAGNLGIGTSTPEAPDGGNADNPLNGQVVSIYGLSPAINLVASSTSGYSLINFGRTGGTTNPSRFVVGYDQASDLGIFAAHNQIVFKQGTLDSANERIRIDNSGRLLVGTSTTNTTANTKIISQLNAAPRGSGSPEAALFLATASSGYALAMGAYDSGSVSSSYTWISSVRSQDSFYDSAAIAPLSFRIADREALRIDSQLRLLVGTSSTSATCRALFQGNSTSSSGATPVLITSGASSPGNGDPMGGIEFGDSSHVTSAWIYANRDSGTWSGSSKPTRLTFSTTADGASSPTERMRITNTGDVLIGTTTTGLANTTGFGLNNPSGVGSYINIGHSSGTGSGFEYLGFSFNGSQIGSIRQSGTTAVTYNTTSDYRLKENLIPIANAIGRIASIPTYRFNFISEPERTVDGFIAHEVQAIVPEAVTGEKDAVDADGNPIYQGIDQSKLVPLLTAALQEAVAKIESLEARLTAAGI